MKIIKKKNEDDCGCGRPLRITDPRRKNGIKKTVPKRNNLK